MFPSSRTFATIGSRPSRLALNGSHRHNRNHSCRPHHPCLPTRASARFHVLTPWVSSQTLAPAKTRRSLTGGAWSGEQRSVSQNHGPGNWGVLGVETSIRDNRFMAVSLSATTDVQRLVIVGPQSSAARLAEGLKFSRQAHHLARDCTTVSIPPTGTQASTMATTTTPFLGCCTISASARGQSPLRRCFSTLSPTLYAQPYFAIKNAKGETFRIQLSKSRELIGIRSTRCQRKYNQDRYKVLVLNPPTPSPEVAAINAASQRENSNPNKTNNGSSNNANQSQSLTKSTEGLQMDADQKSLFYFAIFDGHGGSHTADYLTAKLDQHIEEATPEMVPKVIKDLRKLGGYFRTFRPHFLEPFLPDNFEELYGSKYANKDRQPKIRIKGKGGQVKPMIFIPHPNASEEDQQQELQSLENQLGETVVLEGEGAKEEKKESKPVVMSKLTEPTVVKKEESAPKTQQRPSQNMKKTSKESATDKDFDYDEDEDPFIIAQRRALNRTSPLPGGTSSYFGTDRSEYQQLFLRHKDGGEEVGTQEGQGAQTKESKAIPNTMTLEQRLCLSFLQSDAELIRDRYQDGSTASVVIVQSKGAFWDTTEDLDLILAHVGDTRILLCEAPRGESIQLTTDHHPDASVETDRIRKMAAYVSADSFGENRFLGQLANTRALGDIASKPYGVSSEPELIRRTVKAKEAAFLVLMSDGITGVMSNQEVVDCIKLEESPTLAAANVLNLAEQLGAEDNCTIMVVKLPAWGTPMPDLSKELREYRWQNEAEQARARRR